MVDDGFLVKFVCADTSWCYLCLNNSCSLLLGMGEKGTFRWEIYALPLGRWRAANSSCV